MWDRLLLEIESVYARWEGARTVEERTKLREIAHERGAAAWDPRIQSLRRFEEPTELGSFFFEVRDHVLQRNCDLGAGAQNQIICLREALCVVPPSGTRADIFAELCSEATVRALGSPPPPSPTPPSPTPPSPAPST
jgi:hypothetical protein